MDPIDDVTLKDVIVATAGVLEVSQSELVGPHRYRRLVAARDVAMYVARQVTSATHREIAQVFGKNPAAVVYAVKKVSLSDGPVQRRVTAVIRALSEAGPPEGEPRGTSPTSQPTN